MTPDHAAAVEAVRARHEADKQHEWPLDHWFDQLQEDRGTLLRAYAAVVAERDFIAASGTVVQAGVDFVKNHADQLATLRAQHAALVAERERLHDQLAREWVRLRAVSTYEEARQLLATLGGAEGA
jgi:hypothetical protein